MINKDEKYYARCNEKIKLNEELTMYLYHEGYDHEGSGTIFEYNGKKYRISSYDIPDIQELMKTVDKYKDNIVLDIIDYDESGIRLTYSYMLRFGDVMINCYLNDKNHYVCEVENTGYVFETMWKSDYLFLKYDEKRMDRYMLFDRLIKHLNKKKAELYKDWEDVFEREEYTSNQIKLYGHKCNINILNDLVLGS